MTIKKELKKIVSALGGTSTANTIPGVSKEIVSALGGTSTARTIPGIIGEIADNISGSGSGDYTTATMTIVNRVYNSLGGVDIPYLHDAVELPDGNSQPFIDIGLYAEGASELQEEVTVVGEVLLRNGYELARITSVNHIEVSGDANLISLGGEDYLLEVTGDCTVTFSFD